MEETITNQSGEFRLEHPGAVIHVSQFLNNQGPQFFQPKTVVLQPGASSVRLVLDTRSANLMAAGCRKLNRGEQLIGWGKYGLQFIAATKDVTIRRGEVDVDYVLHKLKTKKGRAILEFWFGTYAMASDPSNDLFISSKDFTQRYLTIAAGPIGLDSFGHLRTGRMWRQTASFGSGAIYRDATPEEAKIFDEIMNAVCFIPYPSKSRKPSPIQLDR